MSKITFGDWMIRQQGYDPESLMFSESIFSLGNGYMGVRGFMAQEENRKNYDLCTYIAGIFDYIKPGITDMANTPNFLKASFQFNGIDLDTNKGNIYNFNRILNMQDGTLTTSFIWEDYAGSRTKIEEIRFLSIANIHNAIQRFKITPINYTGEIVAQIAIDGQIANNPINDDQMKEDINPVVFFKEIEKGVNADGISYITVMTKETKYIISEAFSVNVSRNGTKTENIIYNEEFMSEDKYIAKRICFNMQVGNEYVIDKMVSVYTSRDDVDDVQNATICSVAYANKLGFEGMLKLNKKAWAQKWDIADIVVEGDEKSQTALRYNIFNLIQGNSENDPNVSIGARGIMHGRYKGCYFWDTEIFMLPFYIYTNPKAARNLLMYRYNTLAGAEKNARMQNVEGARYAWMCSIDGTEQCETWDTGCCEVHITADVAYAINQYYEVSGDETFLKDYGAEILIKTARYWKSRFTYFKDDDVYNMLFVKGPNEYGGVTVNNTYTTIMAINNFKLAMKAIDILKSKYIDDWDKLSKKISFCDSEIEKWKDIIDKAVINYDAQRALYIEDDNFLKLEPINIEELKNNDEPLYKKVSFDRLQRYRVLKQADVILLMTLLPDMFTDEEKRAAWNFYEPITLHDSSLSFGTHALFAARLGLKEKAYEYFIKSSRLDLEDIMKNTGKEGIHFASLGATWQAVINGFGGVEIKNGLISINPKLPELWNLLSFKMFYRNCIICVNISKNAVELVLDEKSCCDKINLNVCGECLTLIRGNKTIKSIHNKNKKLF
ncbi:MAG TPA: glycoside hydrolase family 65 protein [Clostridiaceae bacterium]|nr:glycoside hydrolase family 65 protein [Clostridiaceae bacterium]